VDWRAAAYRLARVALFRIDAERSHHVALRAVRAAGEQPLGRLALSVAGGAPLGSAGRPPSGVAVRALGLEFRNRVGIGAGLDKDGMALRGWAALGVGFVELGTVTPRPQPGQPRPRLFRLVADDALINRMGFNNAGAGALAERISLARSRLPRGFVVGVNIGRGRDTAEADAADDYVETYRTLAPVADYVAINVSSPNTPGLRDLQRPQWVGELVERLCAQPVVRPLLVKLSPDLGLAAFEELVTALADTGAEGLILSNTTLAREGLNSPQRVEPGGLSGRPLHPTMLAALNRARDLTGDRFTLIASGGIFDAEDAGQAVAAGASLVQLWTGLVYRGPGLIGEVARSVGERWAAGG
jgi:dihydroorotate dehydrogenase